MSLKVQPCLNDNNVRPRKDLHNTNCPPSFKAGSGGAFSVVGTAMQWVQDKGFLASFLIQDFMGMTLPRTGTAYMRDREVTGEYNFQEGKEVLLREGLTGPIMMSMAPLFLAITSSLFGKSTKVNSQLIKRFGESFKEMISKPEFKKELLNDKKALKNEYLEHNIESMLKNTLGEGNYKETDIKFIMEKLGSYENPPSNPDVKGLFKKRNYKKSCLGEIENRVNGLKYENSADLDMLNKMKVGDAETARAYETVDAMEALMRYSEDIITNNKHLADMTPEVAENFKNASVAKRILSTIATIFGTLGVMSYIPKIYAKSEVSPGARTAMKMKEAAEAELNQEKNNSEEVSFKGKPAPKKGWLEKLGEFICKHQNENRSSEFEYKGHNFTSTLMAMLSIGGLLFPRGIRAYNRALVGEDGKKDKTGDFLDIRIKIDLTSSLTVIFAVPMLTRFFVTSYENKSGFVLMQKDRNRTKSEKVWDLLNPYSKAHVLTSKEIEALYFGVDSNEKMLNFCKYIDKNDGDLQKIFTKSENAGEIFNENMINPKELEKLTKQEKNKKIIEFFETAGKETASKEGLDNSIKKLMQGNGMKAKGNKLLTFAKGLNSMPEAIATVLITPILLGWFIPTITYANTRRIHAKKEREALKNKVDTAA